MPSRDQLARPSPRRRTRTSVGMPARLGRLGHVRGRLDAEHRDAALDEPLQQVAVVAGDLDDLAVLRRGRSARSWLGVGRGMARASSRSRTRSRRSRVKIASGVSSSELHEEALAADVDAERVERLGLAPGPPAPGRSWRAAGRRGRRRRGRAARRRSGIRDRDGSPDLPGRLPPLPQVVQVQVVAVGVHGMPEALVEVDRELAVARQACAAARCSRNRSGSSSR